jgi:hypothetical protein
VGPNNQVFVVNQFLALGSNSDGGQVAFSGPTVQILATNCCVSGSMAQILAADRYGFWFNGSNSGARPLQFLALASSSGDW